MNGLKKLFTKFTLYGALLFSTACHSSGVWNGTYIYVKNSGNTAGGTIISTEYVLKIDASSCKLNIDGFQVEDRILCNAVSNDDVLSVKFKSYGNGSLLNDFGVSVYKVHDVLFSLTKSSDVLITKWITESPDDISSKEGRYFLLK